MKECRHWIRQAIVRLDKKVIKARRLGMDEATIKGLEKHRDNYRQMMADTFVIEDLFREG